MTFSRKGVKLEKDVSGWCHDGSTSSRSITEVKHLELKQFSGGLYFLGNGEFWVCFFTFVYQITPFGIKFALWVYLKKRAKNPSLCKKIPLHVFYHEILFLSEISFISFPLWLQFLLRLSSFLRKLFFPVFVCVSYHEYNQYIAVQWKSSSQIGKLFFLRP